MILRFSLFLLAALPMMGIAIYAIYTAFTYQNAIGSYYLSLLIFLILTPIIFIISSIISFKFYNRLNSFFYTLSSIGLPILIYFFISSVILTVLNWILPEYSNLYPLAVYTLITLCFILVIYGIINSYIFKLRKITIPASKLASLKDKKIILLADSHIGLIHKKNFLKRAINFVNKQNPDIVIFAGDLIDGAKIPFSQFLEPVSLLKAKDGVYYSPGNHEAYSKDTKTLYKVVEDYMQILHDKKTSLGEIDILGLSYDAFEGKDAIINRLYKAEYKIERPTIVINHSPKNNEALLEAGVDLVVSGHTHGGQLWPFTIIAKKLFKGYARGVVKYKDSYSITTVGIGTWGPPLRIATRPEIVEITFQ